MKRPLFTCTAGMVKSRLGQRLSFQLAPAESWRPAIQPAGFASVALSLAVTKRRAQIPRSVVASKDGTELRGLEAIANFQARAGLAEFAGRDCLPGDEQVMQATGAGQAGSQGCVQDGAGIVQLSLRIFNG